MKEISKLFDPDKQNQKLKLDDLLTSSINLNYWEENEEEFMEFIEKNFSIIKPYQNDLKSQFEFSSRVYGMSCNSIKSNIYITRTNNYEVSVSIM